MRPRWLVAGGIAVVVAVALLTAVATAPQPGGTLDPTSTGAAGARALVTMLRDAGVEVVPAATVADVERAAAPATLLVVASTDVVLTGELVARLAAVPGDRLLIAPDPDVREGLASGVEVDGVDAGEPDPGCDLPAARRAGRISVGLGQRYLAGGAATRCYGGMLLRLRDGAATVTLLGSGDVVTNDGIAAAGNAALALNLLGEGARIIWFAPQVVEPGTVERRGLGESIPERVDWAMWQLVVVVALLALWRGRRLGPLVAERLPVVVRASETTEGRGRLYRARRARDSAAAALRNATASRLAPRLGSAPGADPSALVAAVAARTGRRHAELHALLTGPPPADDAALVALAHALDDIERQVSHP